MTSSGQWLSKFRVIPVAAILAMSCLAASAQTKKSTPPPAHPTPPPQRTPPQTRVTPFAQRNPQPRQPNVPQRMLPVRPLAAAPDRVVHISGGEVAYRPNGQLRTLYSNGMLVHRAPNGLRLVSVERPDHSCVVVLPGGGGWIQRPFQHGDITYARRTYVMGGVTYIRYYQEARYASTTLDLYVPLRYFRPSFYVWAARPWGRSIGYNWDWRTRPWFAGERRAFAPYTYYATASMWITDFVLSSAMDAAYQQGFGGQQTMPLSDYGKAQIESEVRQQTLAMGDEADRQIRGLPADPDSGSISHALGDNKVHTFVTGTVLLVVNAGGDECSLSPGDSVQLMPGSREPDAATVEVSVLWGKGAQDCRTGSIVTVAVQDLQEMQNSMRASIDQGLDKLWSQQGSRVPPVPGDANGPSSAQAFLLDAPQTDLGAQVEIEAENRKADAVERDMGSQ